MNTRAKTLRLSRGQSLVLMGLNMLLLTLLVCMTLSFGQKAKEKMELQMMADQAAYSTSVATARAFNELAVMNRTIVADNVVQLGVDASISFSTLVFGIMDWLMIDYIIELFGNQMPQCDPPWQWCGCFGIFGVALGRIWPLWMRGWAIYGMFMGLDMAAASQANTAATNALIQWVMQGLVMMQMYTQRLSSQNQGRNAVNITSAGQPDITVPGAAGITMDEVGIIPFTGAINLSNIILSDQHAVAAAMGSRTHPWTAGRLNLNGFSLSGSGQVLNTFFRSVAGNDVQLVFSDGTSYFSKGKVHGNWLLSPAASSWAVSDDHLIFEEQYSGIGCSGLPLIGFSVAGVEGNDSYGLHLGSGFGMIFGFPDEVLWFFLPFWPWDWQDMNHVVPSVCVMNCPSAWSNFVDYDDRKLLPSWGGIGGGWQDNWGQPKAPTTVQRDYRARPGSLDPWDIAFHLNWGGRSTDFNMKENYGSGGSNGIRLNPMTSGCSGANCDISKQTALSTGITYYHRGGGHFKEPPNLFNPWWKAGLIHSDADQKASPQNSGCGGNDIVSQLNSAGAGWTTDAATQLCMKGYRGWQ